LVQSNFFNPIEGADMAVPKLLQNLSKTVNFYGRFTPSFTRIGYVARLLPFKAVSETFYGQHWLITGATGGIGRAAALMAAAKGAHVFAVGRNSSALDSLVAASQGLGGSITPLMCDLSSVTAIGKMVRDLKQSDKINVLVNNVGILNRTFSATQEGFETTYVTNLLGHFHLTETLSEVDCLARGATIINVTSGGMFNAPLNLTMIDQAENGFNGFSAYASHKRAQVALADHWREAFRDLDVQTYVTHPGWADTVGVQTSLPTFRKILKPILRNANQAADTLIWLAAKRPAVIEDRVWFDRKQRTTHAYPHTRRPLTTVSSLISRLEADRTRMV
jgi:dehydrogenase/reductase SDR family member 12